jgi:hypothetical protein
MRSMGSMAAAINGGGMVPPNCHAAHLQEGKMFGGEDGRAKSPG